MPEVGWKNEAFTFDEDKKVKDEIHISSKTQCEIQKNTFYDFDILLKEIGQLGKYQIFLIALVYWITLPAGSCAFI